VEIAKESGCLVEVTNLVIPNWNDGEEDVRAFVDWAAAVDPGMPVHFSRYHPDYKLTEPPTPAETLSRAYEVAREKLRYVYLGNIQSGEGENTRCPGCGEVVVERRGFTVSRLSVRGGSCELCGAAVDILGT